MISFNPTASANDAAKITVAAGTVKPPDWNGNKNSLFVLPLIWKTPAAARCIFGVPSSEGATTVARHTMTLDWDHSNSQLRLVMHAAGSSSFVLLTLTSAFDGITDPTPALIMVRTTDSGSGGVNIELYGVVYGGSPESDTDATFAAALIAPSTAAGEWGYGRITVFDSPFTSMGFQQATSIRDVTFLPALFRAYASAGAVPACADVSAALQANIGDLFAGAAFGSPSHVAGIGFPFSGGDAGGTASFTQYGVGTQITSSVVNVLCFSADVGSGTDYVKTNREDATVVGTHTVVNPFVAAPDDYVRQVVTDPLAGVPAADKASGYAGFWNAWGRDALATAMNVVVTGQSWAVGQGSSPCTEVGAGLGCGCGFAQGLTLALRAECVGQLLNEPIGDAATTGRQQQHKLGFTTAFGGSTAIDVPTFSNAACDGNIGTNYADFLAFGINGTAVSNGTITSLGGYPTVTSFNTALAAEWSMAVDFRDFSMVEDDTPVAFAAHFLSYGGAATSVSVQGETREVDTAHGTEAQAQLVVAGDAGVSLDTGEGVEREIATIAAASANAQVITFEGDADDLDPVSIAYGVANPHASDARGWLALISDSTRTWIKPISAASYNAETGVWSVTIRPGFHNAPATTATVPDETTTIRCSRWAVKTLRVAGVQDGSRPIRALRCKRAAGAGGRAVFIGFDWSIDAVGVRVGGLGSGSSNYGQWDVQNAPCLYWHLLRACGANAAVMMNTAVTADGQFSTQIQRLRTVAPDGVVAVFVGRIATSSVDLSPATDSNRSRFRSECSALKVPYYDLVAAAGTVGDNLLRWDFQDQTHFSGVGYYRQATLLLDELDTLALASGGGGGRRPLIFVNPDDLEDEL